MSRIRQVLEGLTAARRAGLLGLPPRAVAPSIRALRAYGPLGAAATMNALRFGSRTALVDEHGTLTFADLERRSNALANAWRARGLGPASRVGILCRNHRGLLDAMTAAAKIGAGVLFLNTDFGGPQLAQTVEREGVTALVHDEEFTPVAAGAPAPQGRFVAWTDRPGGGDLERLIAEGDPAPPPAPGRHGSLVILTSGTSGAPKGAPRSSGPSAAWLPVGIVHRIPFRPGESVFVGPPMFHGWGLTAMLVTLGTGSVLLLRRRFDADAVLDLLERHRVRALVAVPVMLSRLLAADARRENRPRLRLRIIATGGAALSPALAERVMARFGPVLYNFYGSTEASSISIATPEDLRAAPGCVGRPTLGTTVKILDASGREVPPGVTGQIHIDSPLRFAGYTGGGTKPTAGKLMAVGDLGHLDAAGRLFIDGRADDMIVSGGENVYPAEVEELLAGHPGIREAAVVGVPDEEFGQRLRAYVVAADTALGEEEVRRYVSANLARYKVPRDVVFVEELPRTSTGKVLKRLLPR
ncbi:AMP-binding protein [Thermomonospora sp. CIF 1]|uniref:AMP-binding protein n=1 Tax=Thermomonospora sp. CIF 1 TaxID=1916083 RepID=UPI000A830382|nr:AMP-binding protein [Thermomonospora sp. CIF 1]PKK15585.1 MAG: acyl-CoA synthetase [Thermomonospora sp. CIF 1]